MHLRRGVRPPLPLRSFGDAGQQCRSEGREGRPPSHCDGGEGATKAEIVSVWKRLRSRSVTGHSTRRSGALQYIRKGWAISQVGYLGRWKSNELYSRVCTRSSGIDGSQCLQLSMTRPPAPRVTRRLLLYIIPHLLGQTAGEQSRQGSCCPPERRIGLTQI